MQKCVIKWVNVEVNGSVNFISPQHQYLILSGLLSTGLLELSPNNIISGGVDFKYLDTLSAESDYYTRLMSLTNCYLDGSNLRTGQTELFNGFVKVQIIEFINSDKN